jgi:hypothetical protein
MNNIGPKHPAETKLVRFSFVKDLEATATITVAAVSCTVDSGIDAAPAALLLGLPQIVGQEVLQRVTGGLHGVSYHLECLATDSTGLGHMSQAVMQVLRVLH